MYLKSGDLSNRTKRLTLDPNVGIIIYMLQSESRRGLRLDRAFRPAVTCGRFYGHLCWFFCCEEAMQVVLACRERPHLQAVNA